MTTTSRDLYRLKIGKQRRSFPKDVQVGVVGIDNGFADFGAWFEDVFLAHELDVVRHFLKI